MDYQHSTHKKDELLTISYRFSHSPNDNKDYTELKNVVNYNPWLGYPQNNINKAYERAHRAGGLYDPYVEGSDLGGWRKIYIPPEPE